MMTILEPMSSGVIVVKFAADFHDGWVVAAVRW